MEGVSTRRAARGDDDTDAPEEGASGLQIDRAIASLCRLLPIGERHPASEIKREDGRRFGRGKTYCNLGRYLAALVPGAGRPEPLGPMLAVVHGEGGDRRASDPS
jgi:hypothetical protein